jgi:uncharacterized protein YndB with AHSA1/START domain
VVRLERLLPGPIERVWAFLVEPDKRMRWFAGGPIEPRVGGAVKLVFQHTNITDEPIPERWKAAASGGEMIGTVTRWEPPHTLGYTWNEGGAASEVTFVLSEKGADVLLTLTHRQLPSREEMIDVSGGWHAHVNVLAALLDGRVAGQFWADVARFETHYREAYPLDAAG